MYVMTPFTSLLVLENEDMYKQYKVDRGRKDHWALYPCPDKIKVVHEPDPRLAGAKPRTAKEVLQTVVVRQPPRFFNRPNQVAEGLLVNRLETHTGSLMFGVGVNGDAASPRKAPPPAFSPSGEMGIDLGLQTPRPGIPRVQFAPVFVSPQMQWAVPNGTVVPALTVPMLGPTRPQQALERL